MAHEPDVGDETLVPQNALRFPPRASRTVPHLRWTDEAGPHRVALDGCTTAGSASKAEIVVADPTVSRLHAELEPRADGVWVRDLGSKNGTFVEGVLVEAARVPDGGKLRLGSTELVVEVDPTPSLVELWTSDRFGPLVGASVPMRETFARLAKMARSDAPVLIHGETGTGKELFALALHEASPRADGPFVVVDCASLSPTLMESELFGHAKGSFTGAQANRVGAIEAAHGGTVFLDEIGELPLALQPKLLRVLESKTVRRVGETNYRDVDVRFVCATHRDLRTMVNAGAFREDLYFRLAVLPLTVPPLRARRDDVPLLIEHFLQGAARPGERVPPLEPDVVRELCARPWLGNVRELRNFVERAKALGVREALALDAGQPVGPSQLPPAATMSTPPTAAPASSDPQALHVSADRPFKEARETWIDAFERAYVADLLERHGRNVSAAAQAAGLDRTYIYRLMRRHDL